MTTATTEPRNVPLPAGAESADAWEVSNDERVTRVFANAERGTIVRVGIVGKQDYSGEVLYRTILVDVSDRHGMVDVNAAAARRIAADLLEAANELNRLANLRITPRPGVGGCP